MGTLVGLMSIGAIIVYTGFSIHLWVRRGYKTRPEESAVSIKAIV